MPLALTVGICLLGSAFEIDDEPSESQAELLAEFERRKRVSNKPIITVCVSEHFCVFFMCVCGVGVLVFVEFIFNHLKEELFKFGL